MKLNRRQLRRLIENTLREQSKKIDHLGPVSGGELSADPFVINAGEEYSFKASNPADEIVPMYVYIDEGDHKKVALQGKAHGDSGVKGLHVTDDNGEIVVGLMKGGPHHFTLKNSGSQPVTVSINIMEPFNEYPGGRPPEGVEDFSRQQGVPNRFRDDKYRTDR